MFKGAVLRSGEFIRVKIGIMIKTRRVNVQDVCRRVLTQCDHREAWQVFLSSTTMLQYSGHGDFHNSCLKRSAW